MTTLVTGAAGFVGTALIARLAADGQHRVRAATHRHGRSMPAGVEAVHLDLATHHDWGTALAGVETIVHLAARVHVMHERAADPLAEFRRVNVAGTINLAREAAAAGVRRFIFLSTVKVHGETGFFTEADPPAPQDAYSISKHEAELALRDVGGQTGMRVVIVRPPLVYGPGVRANFEALMRAIAYGIPLPFGAIHNRRSLVALDNLVDFLVACIDHPSAADETFLVSDGHDLSTPDLIRGVARAMGRKTRIVAIPPAVLAGAAALVGRRDLARRLLGSLQVDITKARQTLSWTPPVPVAEALKRAVTMPS
jgi:nucleoside-diphosphate-sugar epimerase